jgi:hypothetical protein
MKQELPAKPSNLRFIAVVVISTLLFILGAPQRVLRNVFGPWKYWVTGFIITALLLANPLTLIQGYLFFAIWLTIGFYQEFEERGRANFWIAMFSVALGSGVALLGPYLWAKASGFDLPAVMRQSLDQALGQFLKGKNPSELGIDTQAIINLFPSMVIGTVMMALGFSLMLDRKFATLMGLRFQKVASQMRLLEFKAPDSLIWVTMIAFLFSFLKGTPTEVSILALNVFNVVMGVYLFQGLAVLEVSFLAFRVGPIMKVLIYVLVVGQLFFLLSAVGVIDYWADFRQRLKRWKMPERSQNHGD